MKKLLLALIASLALCGTAVAQQGQSITTITFPAFVAGSPNMATPPTGAEILPIIQSGNTRKITLGQITTPVTVQPGSPVTYQPWMNVGNSPPAFEIWDGAQYVTAWTLNSSTHAIAFNSAGITNGLGYTPLNRAGDTMTGELSTSPSSGSSAGFNLGQGSAPSSPANGDFWITSAGAFYRAGGSTIGPLIGSGGSAVTSVFGRTGSVVAQTGDYTPTQVGLGSVTNDAQTKAAIVPNTVPSAGQILAGNAGGTAYAPVTMSGDATLASSGAISVSKSGGVAFGTAAFVNTGTSGATLGLLNGNLTFGGSNAYGTPASITLTNATGLPISTGITGLGTGVATALGNAVNATGGPLTYSIIGTSGAALPLLNGVNIWSGAQTISGASFGLSGNFSAPDWNTAGVRYKNAAATITDTTSTGTVATAYTDLFGGNTIAASSATTFTNYYGAYFKAPVAGTNVTLTNKYALGADSANFGSIVDNGVTGSTQCLHASSTGLISGTGSDCSSGGGNASFGTTTGNTANDFVTMSNTTVGVKDSALALSTDGTMASNSDSLVPSQKSVVTYVGAHTGACTLINTLTASASASLTDTTSLTSSYKTYHLIFNGIYFSTAAGSDYLEVFVSTNGGSSYDSTAANYQLTDYNTEINQAGSIANIVGGGGALVAPSTGAFGMTGLWVNSGVMATSTKPTSGEVIVYNPSAATQHNFEYRLVSYSGGAAAGGYQIGGGIYVGSTSAVNAVKFVPASVATITAGTVEIVGCN